MKRLYLFLVSTFFLSGAFVASAQLASTPPNGGNQKSVTRQYLGNLSFVEIIYNSPDVAGRDGKIWGQLVPYGKSNLGFALSTADNPSPWRAGANENTTIEFSHDMQIQGKDIKAGKYGFHVVPTETGPWQIILSSESNAWGSFSYVPEEEVLVVETTVKENEFNEYLTFEFTDRKVDQVTVELKWERLSMPFTITQPNQKELILASLTSELKNSAGFSHLNLTAASFWASGAGYHDQAIAWADAAISAPFFGQRDYVTLSTKANALNVAGKTEEANKIMDEAIKLEGATAFQVHAYGRQLIGQGQKEKALEVFKYNQKQNKGVWPTNYGLARGYSAVGDYKNALKYLKLALSNVPANDTANPPVIKANIAKLEKGEDIN